MHPIISCEGTAEYVIATMLREADAFVFRASNIIDITRKRKAADIKDAYLNYDFDFDVCILRIIDSRSAKFNLGKLYAGRFPIYDVLTRPEIEVLSIINEKQWSKWKKSKKRPSEFCKDDLRMRGVKSAEFLTRYWDVDSLAKAAIEYKRLSSIARGEYCLADIIKS
jgi:hypothetical protein